MTKNNNNTENYEYFKIISDTIPYEADFIIKTTAAFTVYVIENYNKLLSAPFLKKGIKKSRKEFSGLEQNILEIGRLSKELASRGEENLTDDELNCIKSCNQVVAAFQEVSSLEDSLINTSEKNKKTVEIKIRSYLTGLATVEETYEKISNVIKKYDKESKVIEYIEGIQDFYYFSASMLKHIFELKNIKIKDKGKTDKHIIENSGIILIRKTLQRVIENCDNNQISEELTNILESIEYIPPKISSGKRVKVKKLKHIKDKITNIMYH